MGSPVLDSTPHTAPGAGGGSSFWSQGVQDIAAYVDQFGTDKIAEIVFVDAGVSAGAQEVRLNPQLSERILEMAGSLATDPPGVFCD